MLSEHNDVISPYKLLQFHCKPNLLLILRRNNISYNFRYSVIPLCYSFIPLASAECDDSLPFSGASSIPLCYVVFLPHFSTNHSSILAHLILPFILVPPLNFVVPKFIYNIL